MLSREKICRDMHAIYSFSNVQSLCFESSYFDLFADSSSDFTESAARRPTSHGE